jgi:hypothetical protein
VDKDCLESGGEFPIGACGRVAHGDAATARGTSSAGSEATEQCSRLGRTWPQSRCSARRCSVGRVDAVQCRAGRCCTVCGGAVLCSVGRAVLLRCGRLLFVGNSAVRSRCAVCGPGRSLATVAGPVRFAVAVRFAVRLHEFDTLTSSPATSTGERITIRPPTNRPTSVALGGTTDAPRSRRRCPASSR